MIIKMFKVDDMFQRLSEIFNFSTDNSLKFSTVGTPLNLVKAIVKCRTC